MTSDPTLGAMGHVGLNLALATFIVLIDKGVISADQRFSGTIIYTDRAKIRRRFVFTRRCPRGSDRFLRTDDPEDEYTD
ncbi:MAG: hypothetical protein H0X27_08610 [Caulobacteraceae bacterium]|nr:hypothetical protein [Caulobacteraceae bacterium]